MSRQTGTIRRLVGILAETPVHAGTGAQLGAVDLPIQRERHTGWPTIYGSGLKGVFRDHAQAEPDVFKNGQVAAVFGPETEKGSGGKEQDRYAGALTISDARLLLLPVRSSGAAFRWVTCPMALARLSRDAADAGLQAPPSIGSEKGPDADTALVPAKLPGDRVLLEEFDFSARQSDDAKKIAAWIGDQLFPTAREYGYWREQVQKTLAIVSDDDFTDFCQHATEITTRVKLEEGTKTVQRGALWTEENLPSDSLLYSMCVAWPPAQGAAAGIDGGAGGVMGLFEQLVKARRVIQVGGKETVGRGFVAIRISGGNNGEA